MIYTIIPYPPVISLCFVGVGYWSSDPTPFENISDFTGSEEFHWPGFSDFTGALRCDWLRFRIPQLPVCFDWSTFWILINVGKGDDITLITSKQMHGLFLWCHKGIWNALFILILIVKVSLHHTNDITTGAYVCCVMSRILHIKWLFCDVIFF